MPRLTLPTVITILLLVAGVVGLQAMHERRPVPAAAGNSVLYLHSGEVAGRAALSYDTLLADVYWIRAVQHYGRTKLSTDAHKQYDLLYPLLDLTTSLDPRFDVAYRFGAIFLAEDYPGGAGRPDLAIALLEKGLRAQPRRWQYAQDIGFIHYWWRRDYSQAADWFKRAARMPAAPNWLAPLAAVTLAEGGNRQSSRRLWQQVFDNADAEWLMDQARFRLAQLDALDQIAALEQVVQVFQQRHGVIPRSWNDLVRAGYLRGVPIDPQQHPYQLNPFTGAVLLAADSPLNPLPTPELHR